MIKRFTVAALAALSLLASIPASADYVIKDGAGATQTIGSFDLNGVKFPKHVMVDPTTGAAIGVATDAKLEAVRALLAAALTINLPAGAATDAKLEAVRALLAGTLTIGLPPGAATDAKLEAVRALLAGSLTVNLPAGGTTAARQDTGNGSLASIDGKVPAQVGGGLPTTPTVGGYAGVAIASFVRPANSTAYAAGQLVANSTTAGLVTPMQFTVARTAAGTGVIRRGRLTKSSTSTLYATFDLMLYKPTGAATCPTSAAGDGATYSTDSALLYLGRIPVSMDQAFTDGAKGIGVPATGSEIVFDALAGSQIVCGFVRATGGYTPVSGETFTAALEVLPN